MKLSIRGRNVIRIMATFIVALISIHLPVVPIYAGTIHVPVDQPTIQAGIDAAADGDTVLVADGTYTGEGNRNLDFGGRAITVRSENGPETCIIDCEQGGRGFNFIRGETASALVEGLTIRNGWLAALNGGAINCDGASPTIRDCRFDANTARDGGGICLVDSSTMIDGCRFTGNLNHGSGGGLRLRDSTALVTGCRFTGNGDDVTGAFGGGINASSSILTLSDSLLLNNSGYNGGGLLAYGSAIIIQGCTFIGNTARIDGGGIYVGSGGVDVRDSIVHGNGVDNIWLGGGWLTATYSDLYDFLGNDWPGEGNINADPIFVSGPDGNHYLSQVAAGQPVNSPCVNSGDPTSFVPDGTTRTDEVRDTGAVDMGYHYPIPSGATLRVHPAELSFSGMAGGKPTSSQTLQIWSGTGDALDWTVSDDALWLTISTESGTSSGETDEVIVVADPESLGAGTYSAWITVNSPQAHNSWVFVPVTFTVIPVGASLVAGPGPSSGNPPLVRVFPPENDASHFSEFTAYGSARWGVNVAAGDLDGDGLDEIVTGPGPGGIFGPHVRGFEVFGSSLPGLSFLAYGTNRYGVNVTTGDLDGDGLDEIITGAGPGRVFGPHVRAFSYSSGTVEPVPGVSFFAYGTPKWGVNVAAGDLDGDGVDEIVTGPGPGAAYGPHVRGWDVDGGAASPIPEVSFMAYGTFRYGVRVSCGDVDGDGIDEVVTAPGPSRSFGAHVRGWNYDGDALTPLPGLSFFAWAPAEARYGARIWSATDLDADGRDEIIVGPGPDPAVGSPVKVFHYNGSGVIEQFSLQAFPEGWTHGTVVAAGWF